MSGNRERTYVFESIKTWRYMLATWLMGLITGLVIGAPVGAYFALEWVIWKLEHR